MRTIWIWILLVILSLPGCANENPLLELEEWDLVYLSDSGGGWGVPEKYVAHIERDTGKTVTIDDKTTDNLSAVDVLRLLQIKALRDDIAKAEVIVLRANPRGAASAGGVQGAVGGCTTCRPPQDCTPKRYESYVVNLKAILKEILAIRDGNPTVIRVLDFYNPFVGKHRCSKEIEDQCIQCWDTFNAAIRQAAEETNIPLVSIYDAFNGPDHDQDPDKKGYIGSDGSHTSEQGQQAIADLLSEAGYKPVEPSSR